MDKTWVTHNDTNNSRKFRGTHNLFNFFESRLKSPTTLEQPVVYRPGHPVCTQADWIRPCDDYANHNTLGPAKNPTLRLVQHGSGRSQVKIETRANPQSPVIVLCLSCHYTRWYLAMHNFLLAAPFSVSLTLVSDIIPPPAIAYFLVYSCIH